MSKEKLKNITNRLKGALDYPIYLLARIMSCFVQSISLESSHRIAKGLAFFIANITRFRRRLILQNLKAAFPELDEQEHSRIMLGMWEHLVLMMIEVVLAPRKIHDTNWRDHIELDGIQEILADLNGGERSCMLITGHFGNFELGGYALGLLGYPSYSIARPLDNPYLDKYIKSLREATGQYIIDKTGASEEIMEVMDRGDLAAILVDQAAQGKKDFWLEFFNRPACVYRSIALLALQYRAVSAVCFALRVQNRPLNFIFRLESLLDPMEKCEATAGAFEFTTWYTKQLENAIARDPEQYWWVHDRWKNRQGITLEDCRGGKRKKKKEPTV